MGLPRYDIWGRPRGIAGVYGSLYEQRSRAEGEKKGSLSSRGQNLWGPWATSSLSTGFSLGQQYVSVSIKLVFFFFNILCSCLTLCNPMDCNPPGSSVHGILQARVQEWVAHSLLQGIVQTQGSCIASRVFPSPFFVENF